MKRFCLIIVICLLLSCQTTTGPPVNSDDKARSYIRNRLAEDIFEVKCKNRFNDRDKDADICILNAVLWAMDNGYHYFVELEPEFIETELGHAEPLSSEGWTRKTIWGLNENPGVLKFMYDAEKVVETIRDKYKKDF